MGRKFDGRQKAEKQEGYEVVKTDLPESRVQDEKQVLTPDQLGITDASNQHTSDPKTMAARKLKSKMSIRPDVTAEVLDGEQVGGVPLAVTQATRSVAGAISVSGADDASRIPYARGNYRPDTRYGKKRSQDLFEMDNTISEQVVTEVEDSLDLRESPDSLQGYNGRHQFKEARSKKNAVFNVAAAGSTHEVALYKVPQQLLNEASADEIHTSKIVYTSGQVIDDQVNGHAGYPSANVLMHDEDGDPVYAGPAMRKANYIPRSFHFDIVDGHIANPHFTEDMHIVNTDPVSRDQANMNARLDEINVARSVIRLQNDLGRETTDKWSPLGYVIDEPYEYNMLMHDIEATTGAIMAASYRAAVSSLAYQKNILGKDGIGPQANAIKMIYEGFAGRMYTNHNNINSLNLQHMVFDQSVYRHGAASALIAMFDSTRKYRTKADLMGMQRSFGLHLSQADNNINPLHVKKEFIKAMDKAHMYSTVTGEYNPMLPIYTTDDIKLVHPISLNFFLTNWKHPATLREYLDNIGDSETRAATRQRYDMSTGLYSNYAYDYTDIRDVYHSNVQMPVISGLIQWMLKHEGAIADTFGQNVTNVTIPVIYNLTAPSLWNFMLCSAAEQVALSRNVIYRDILFAGQQETYIWDDLSSLKEVDPLYSSQLKIGDYSEPLKLGKLSPDTAIRELWGETFQVMANTGDAMQISMPWYFNERAFGSSAHGSYTRSEGWFDERHAFNMTIPSIRDGVRHEYVDLIKSMSERDIRLCLDRIVALPMFTNTGNFGAASPNSPDDSWATTVPGATQNDMISYSNIMDSTLHTNNMHLSSLRYESNSDGRIVAKIDLASGSNNRNWDHHSILCAPRELGWICDNIYGRTVIREIAAEYIEKDGKQVFDHVSIGATALPSSEKYTTTGDYGYGFTGYNPMYLKAYRVASDAFTADSIDRSAALTQIFYCYFASQEADAYNRAFMNRTGIIPTFAFNRNNPVLVTGLYNLDSANRSTAAVTSNLVTFAPALWTMLQRVFLPINRFENCFVYAADAAPVDVMESSFLFGVCGTLASDFSQDVLERLDRYDQLGLGYTEDVFMSASPIFR